MMSCSLVLCCEEKKKHQKKWAFQSWTPRPPPFHRSSPNGSGSRASVNVDWAHGNPNTTARPTFTLVCLSPVPGPVSQSVSRCLVFAAPHIPLSSHTSIPWAPHTPRGVRLRHDTTQHNHNNTLDPQPRCPLVRRSTYWIWQSSFFSKVPFFFFQQAIVVLCNDSRLAHYYCYCSESVNKRSCSRSCMLVHVEANKNLDGPALGCVL